MKNERNYGLDILRILSMFLITTIHFIGYSNILNNPNLSIFNSLFLNFFSSLSTIAVNIFVLITGYFSCEKKLNLKRISLLWAEVVIVSLLLFVVGIVFLKNSFSIVQFIKSIAPIFTMHYWFLVIYVILILISPVLNITINNLEKKTHSLLCVVGFIILCVFFTTNPFINSYIYIANARGLCWFIYLYFIGSYLKKYDLNISGKVNIIISCVLFLMIFLLKYFKLENIGNVILLEGNSVLPFLLSISLFYAFKSIKIKSNFSKRIISEMSTCSFLVYIIQEHDSIRNGYWNLFEINDYSANYSMIFIFFVSILILWPIAYLFKKVFMIIRPLFIFIYDFIENKIKFGEKNNG